MTPFWQSKPLNGLSPQEWESLCDGCGRCCLHKLEDEDSGAIFHTRVACRLLDTQTCRCTRYANRRRWVPDCVRLTAADILRYRWLPETCAYRRLAEGRPLPEWHPLLTGERDSVHRAGASVRGWCISERDVDDLHAHIVEP